MLFVTRRLSAAAAQRSGYVVSGELGRKSRRRLRGAGAAGLSPTYTYALPLLRRPAFPGFYQVIQVIDDSLLDFIGKLKDSGTHHIPAFMTKAPPNPDEDAAPSNFRRDAVLADSMQEMHTVGVLLHLLSVHPHQGNVPGGQVMTMPLRRVVVKGVWESEHTLLPPVVIVDMQQEEVQSNDETALAYHREIIATMKELSQTNHSYQEHFDQVVKFYDIEKSSRLADLVSGLSLANRDDLQALLCITSVRDRLEKVMELMQHDLEMTKLQSHVKTEVEERVGQQQRKYMLTEQLKQIKRELGIEKDDKDSILQAFRDVLETRQIPDEPRRVIEQELAKLSLLEVASSEFNVCRQYLEWLTKMPYGVTTEDNADIAAAESVLNKDHYGLEDAKDRILEFIAVNALRKRAQSMTQGKILCFVGPPGVGKTSLGRSIATALGRKFFRISVGGLSDLAEIRGHRRTYIGAMPGKLIQCLKVTEVSNPLVLIDEIDKIGKDYRGDPSAALLEVLDPEQNSTFRDHYMDVPIDLSKILFICTANVIDTIPGPLLDRMEVIRIAGYVFEEKMAILKRHLLPEVLSESCIPPSSGEIPDDVLRELITSYTREAGVRSLKKYVEQIYRKMALTMVRGGTESRGSRAPEPITRSTLEKFCGIPAYATERLYEQTPPGVVMGLAWTSLGGVSLFVETLAQQPEREGGGAAVRITGQIGQVMTESSQIAHTYARRFLAEQGRDYLENVAVHMHIPEGATPKDGPSAGITMVTALVSLALGQAVAKDIAMTGEVTLTGRVLKVGGIKEKTIAARRDHATVLILPQQNQREYDELKPHHKYGLTAHFVEYYDDIANLIFGIPTPRGTVVTVHPPAREPDRAPTGAKKK